MSAEEERDQSRSATHHIKVSKAFFRALCGAISELSIRTSDLYSFRRLLTHVLASPGPPVYRVDAAILDRLCNTHEVNGGIHLTVRIESHHNDLLREFREHAEAQLGRPVSVAEAMRVCIFIVTGE
jgi:hypothetical protein